MKQSILILILLSILGLQGHAQQQYTFSGSVTDAKEHTPLQGAQVAFIAQDTVAGMALSDKNGKFSVKGLPAGKYTVQTALQGYTTQEKDYDLQSDLNIEIGLFREMSIALDSVVVIGNQDMQVRRTATGFIYQLSAKARNSKNPYLALQEIPQLRINPAQQTIQMEDGSTPKILINGNALNSGINPIDPENIESVEVVKVVSARYLRDGTQSILNIKLKKGRPYVFFEAMTRHNVPLNVGMGALYFEIGNEKISLYARAAGDYLYNNDTETSGWQQNTGYRKSFDNAVQANNRTALGDILFKWAISPKDYLAVLAYGKGSLNKSKSNGKGSLDNNGGKRDYTLWASSRDRSKVYTASLYYKHEFDTQQTFETKIDYNFNKNWNSGTQQELYPDWLYDDFYKFDNRRSSGQINLDYAQAWGLHSLNAGSITSYQNDHIDRVSSGQPVFHYTSWSEYLYAAFTSRVGKLMYMGSLGAEGIWLKAGTAAHHYFVPIVSASATYAFSDNHSINLMYQHGNKKPSTEMLNPYNTSTDSLVITRGNPYLRPSKIHRTDLSYTFNKKGFYLTPMVGYIQNRDMHNPYGYTEDGIYISSYHNSGRYHEYILQASLQYAWKWGYAFASAGHDVRMFEHQPKRKAFFCNIGLQMQYKKFMLYANCNYLNYGYSAVSRTKQRTPGYSLLQATYYFTPNLYVSAALEYLTGAVRYDTHTYSGTYQSLSSVTQRDKNLRPWLLVRYTFRKNIKRKIKLDNVIQSREEGISIK